MKLKHKYNYRWTLADAVFSKDKGKVFSCFACGGGSTMGYKLAGFDVIGCNEIDHRMMYTYCQNHNLKFPFLEPIQEFKNREDLPDELYNLDVLDGSPPCSTFSMAESREEAWGKMKHFREGQAEQVLDTLFFDFIDLAESFLYNASLFEQVSFLHLEFKEPMIPFREVVDYSGCEVTSKVVRKQRAASKGYDVGRNHETGKKIVEMCQHLGIEVLEHAPLRKGWKGKDGKITHEELASFTGLMGRTNQDARDAALLAWAFAGLPIRVKLSK